MCEKCLKMATFVRLGLQKSLKKLEFRNFGSYKKLCKKTKNAVSCLLTVCREVFSAIEGRNHAKGHFILGMKNIMHVRSAIEKSAYVIIV